ncbi:MAG: hypothetical protein ABW034_23515 [Steroidobacteraceae bacterium]
MSFRPSFRFNPTACTAVLALLLGACASEPPAPLNVENTEEVSATVEAVNLDKRLVSLRAPDGRQFTLQMGPQVRNLAQVKVGDRVVARYYKALAAELRRRGDGSGDTVAPVVEAGGARAPAGASPGGAVAMQSRQTVRITGVDNKNHVVSFYGSDGLARSLPVRTPQGEEFISKLKEGDEVEVTYTEAVAVSVEPMK